MRQRLLSPSPSPSSSPSSAACRRRRHHRHRHRKSSFISLSSLLLLYFFFYLLPLVVVVVVQAETEVKWTPNEQDQQAQQEGSGGGGGNSGPLPLSQQQRQQLMQLDAAIQQSPNPQETLEQAAAANQMNPRDLLDILERNRNDMAQSGGGGQGGQGAGPVAGQATPKNVLMQALTSLVLVIGRMARHHPQSFSITTLVIVLCLYTMWTAPRTGLVLSSARRGGGGILSHGPTTLWSPPTTFLRRLLETQQQERQQSVVVAPLKSTSTMWKEMNDLLLSDDNTDSSNDHEAVWHKVGKRTAAPSLQQAVSCQVTIDMNDLLLSSSSASSRPTKKQHIKQQSSRQEEEDKEDAEQEDSDEEEDDEKEADEEDEEKGDELSYMLDIAYDQAFRLLLEQHGPLTEFVDDPPDSSVRFVTLDGNNSDRRKRQEAGLLVVRGLGDWKRYGICPMQVTQQAEDYGSTSEESDDDDNNTRIRLTWSTLREKSHWDGHVQIQVEKQESDGKLVVRVMLLVPVKNKKSPSTSGRKVASKTLAMTIVEALANSIATSVKQRTKLQVARQSQSTRYRGQAVGRAQQRRSSRLTKERQIEEMAADRRRRWQRQNPNSGHYRPSGTRMQSPNNAVYN